MGMRVTTDDDAGVTPTVDSLIGDAYPIVEYVHKYLGEIRYVTANMEHIYNTSHAVGSEVLATVENIIANQDATFAAADSAAASAVTATAAKDVAVPAATAATDAKTAAEAAQVSANTSATNAIDAAISASASVTAAGNSATAAAGSASTANARANDATFSAAAASNSATAASGSASTATSQASAASSSATNAATSATEAAASATSAAADAAVHGWSRIATQTPVATAGVVFSLPSTWDVFKLVGQQLKPSAEGYLYVRFSYDGGATYKLAATDYFYGYTYNDDSTVAGGDFETGLIQLSGNADPTSIAALEMTVFPGAAGVRAQIMAQGFSINAFNVHAQFSVGGECKENISRPTHMIVAFSGANISGKLLLLGSKA
jgi:hypothetical protein